MISMGVSNFKSLCKIDNIDIKPITVLVGKNSSGKSSFIRILPLLKQSIETKTSESLLWYGKYVDFGSFEECICKSNNKQDNIKIDLKFEVNKLDTRLVYIYTNMRDVFKNINSKYVKLSISICKNIIDKINIQIYDQEIDIKYDRNFDILELHINGELMNDKTLKSVKGQEKSFIPEIFLFDKQNNENYLRLKRIYLFEDNIFKKKLIEHLKKESTKNTNNDTLERIINKISISYKDDIYKSLLRGNLPKRLMEKLKAKNREDNFFEKFNNLFVASLINEIIMIINEALERELNSIKYMKPIRATVERYYRIQGVDVTELDSAGSNLAMLINSLKMDEKKRFSEWSKKHFGVSFSIEKNKGHVSLILNDLENEETINLADVGYGYSQVLPIIMNLWLTSEKIQSNFSKEKNITLIIEQPELHLHPALQARLIDVFVEIIDKMNEQDIELKIIFETHSETMVNRLGYLVSKGYLKNDLVNIVIFNKENCETRVNSVKFDNKGILKGWPVGFFSPPRKDKRC